MQRPQKSRLDFQVRTGDRAYSRVERSGVGKAAWELKLGRQCSAGGRAVAQESSVLDISLITTH